MERNDVWDGAQETRGTFNSPTAILVNGASFALTPGTPFKETVLGYAKDAGFGKFRIFLNNEEIKPSQAPEILSEGDHVEIRPYDVAGF